MQSGGGFGQPYLNPATETAADGDVQVWQIANLTADTHPIHFHLVNVQVISRQPFAVTSYTGVPNLKGAPVPPPPEERGLEGDGPDESGRGHDGDHEVRAGRAAIRDTAGNVVDLQSSGGGLGSPPPSPRTGGNEYVWHCHILEHEEHDMMRPLVVGG